MTSAVTSPVTSTVTSARLSPPGLLPRVRREQHKKLEEHFKECRHPTETDLILISAEIGLEEQEAKTWFEHRLALWRKQQGLPANYGHIQ